jgi:cysteine-rich repeat protein
VYDEEEECDDSNETSGDGCSSTCQAEPIALALGSEFTCAVLGDGRLKCWGLNEQGQLGLGTSKATYGADPGEMGAALPSVFESGVTAVAAGTTHACAIRDEQVYCWGDNHEFQLGVASTAATENRPVSLGISDAVELSGGGGNLTAVRLRSGEVLVWGVGAPSHRTVPFSNEAVAIACGVEIVCAILKSHAVECWDPIGGGAPIVVTVASHGASQPVALSAGYHTCVLGVAGDVYCFGENPSGNLVSGDAEDRVGNVPSGTAWPAALLGPDVVGISLAGHVTCATYRDGTVKCWGFSWYGVSGQPGLVMNEDPLGDSLEETGTNIPPIRLGSDAVVKKVFAGAVRVCALLTDGRVKCWGNNSGGALGNGNREDVGIEASQLGDNLAETVID